MQPMNRFLRTGALLSLLLTCASSSPTFGQTPKDLRIRYPGIEIDPQKREIVATGTFLLDHGLIELLLTSRGGKEHESILVMDGAPHLLQAGLILIGLKPGEGVRYLGDQRVPRGSRVLILVRWKEKNQTQTVRAEDLIWNQIRKKPMPRKGWIFTGSQFARTHDSGKEVFLASQSGAIAVTYHDPTAILDTPLLGGSDDTLYHANPDRCPAPGTRVEILFRPYPEDSTKKSTD